LHHAALTVTDLAASATWYLEVLGLEQVFQEVTDTGGRAVLRIPASGQMVGLVQHGGGEGDFDPHRTGLDHLAFSVGSREEVEWWVGWFDERGVTHSGLNETPFGAMLNFKDPDDIALTMHWERGFPAGP